MYTLVCVDRFILLLSALTHIFKSTWISFGYLTKLRLYRNEFLNK